MEPVFTPHPPCGPATLVTSKLSVCKRDMNETRWPSHKQATQVYTRCSLLGDKLVHVAASVRTADAVSSAEFHQMLP